MQDHGGFDPDMLKEAASAISKSLTADAAEKEKERRDSEEIKKQITHTPTVRCDACQHYIFKPGTLFKRFDAKTSPSGEEMLVPVEVYECSKCGHVNAEFMPSFLVLDLKRTDENGLPTY